MLKNIKELIRIPEKLKHLDCRLLAVEGVLVAVPKYITYAVGENSLGWRVMYTPETKKHFFRKQTENVCVFQAFQKAVQYLATLEPLNSKGKTKLKSDEVRSKRYKTGIRGISMAFSYRPLRKVTEVSFVVCRRKQLKRVYIGRDTDITPELLTERFNKAKAIHDKMKEEDAKSNY